MKIAGRLRRLFDRLRGALFDNDVFISYARRDAAFYATELGKLLQAKKLAVYLDQYASWPDRRIPREVVHELCRSRMMVVIGSEAALGSRAVVREVRLFLRLHRAMVPIAVAPYDTREAWTQEPWRTIQGALSETEQEQDVKDARVTPRVVERIVSAITFRTRAQRQRLIATATAMFVVASGIFMLLAMRSAARSAADARASTLAAESMIQGETHPYFGLAFAAAAYDAAPDRVSVDTRRALFMANERARGVRRLFTPEELTRIGGGGTSAGWP